MCGSDCVTVESCCRFLAIPEVGEDAPAAAVESVKPAHTESVEPFAKQTQAWTATRDLILVHLHQLLHQVGVEMCSCARAIVQETAVPPVPVPVPCPEFQVGGNIEVNSMSLARMPASG